MSPNLPQDILKLVLALLKHQLELWLGKEFVGIAATTLADIGGEKLQEFIDGKEGPKELLELGKRADTLFQERCTDKDLLGAFSIDFGNQKAIQASLKTLPNSMSKEEIQKSVRELIKRDFGTVLNQNQIETGAQLYTECLLEALVPLENYAQPAIGAMVGTALQKLDSIHDEQREGFKTVNEKLDRLATRGEPSSQQAKSEFTFPDNLKPQLFQIDPWIQPLSVKELNTSKEISSSKPLPIINVLKTDKKIILVGNSGSGKTSTLKSIANLLNESSKFACCWIPLKNYSKNLGHTIKEVVDWRDIQDDQVIQILERQNTTLILDGLNEVTIKDQEDCIKEINILLSNYQGQVCISFTISDVAYFGFEYPTYIVSPLDKNDIEKTIKDFFKEKGTSHKANWFLQSIRGWDPERQQEFDNLACLPINLQFLLELAQSDHFSYNSLGDLYGQVIQKRLERTKLNSQRNQISIDIKTDCLTGLAYKAILKDHQLQMQKDFIRETFAEIINTTKTDADLALKEVVRAGLLLEVNDFLLEWPHSSFRDYLAGRQIFTLIETDKSFADFPLEKTNGLTAAAHATRMLTSQTRKLEKRNLIFLAVLDKHPNLEAIKTIAEEYRPPTDYYISTNQEIKYEESEFTKSKWGERFIETYNRIKVICQQNGIEGTEKIPTIKGLKVYFDREKDFCLIIFSNDIGITLGDLETLDKQLSHRARRKNSKTGFCLFAPFLSLLDPEIIAYLQIGLWLIHKVGKEQTGLNDWLVGLTTYISPQKDWIYWQKQEYPKDDFEICASQEDAAKFIMKHFGRERLNEVTKHMDLIGHSKKEMLGWDEIYMPIAFEINPSKTIEQPRLTSNRGVELMLRTLPNHNVSLLLFLPMISSLQKTDFNAKIYIPFPISILNRFYFMYYQQETFHLGKFFTFVHLRG